jgi:hypothetical protein
MFTTAIKVGRLYEHRIWTLESTGEIGQLGATGKATMATAEGQVVVCADYRYIEFLQPDLAGMLAEAIRGMNPKVERSAILIDRSHSIFSLQIRRMVKEMGFAGRQVFMGADECCQFLGERLVPAEQARLQAFLHEGEAAAALRAPSAP